MKKLMLLVGLLFVAGIPLMAADVTVGGVLDLNYVMDSPADDDDDEPSESYFGTVSTKLTTKADFGDDLIGFAKLNFVEDINMGTGHSYGMDTIGILTVEEAWVSKANAFGQEGLGFKFGKMEVPGNLDIDNGITHSLSNRFEIDYTWGLNVNYAVEGVGTFNLTTFEGMGGLDATGPDDEDTGLFSSLSLQWDTGENAFEVEGLRLVVAYGMLASDDDQDDGSVISIGGTYSLAGMDVPLTIGLEIDMVSNVDIGDFYVDDQVALDLGSAMLMALNVDYDINEEFSVGLSYETLAVDEDDLDAPSIPAAIEKQTITRLALRGEYNVAEDVKMRFEYADISNDNSDIAVDTSTADKETGGNTIAIGVLATF
jgi:hypothetical protein